MSNKNNKTKKIEKEKESDDDPERKSMTDEEIANIDLNSKEVKNLMKEYEE